MTRPTPAQVNLERTVADRHWHDYRHYSPPLTVDTSGWQYRDTDSGPMWSMQLSGPDAAKALIGFAASPYGIHHLHPLLDYGVPGRTAVVWQSNGVWLEVWHPDTADAAPGPVSGPSHTRPVPSRLGGRLPFTRNRTQKKENAA